MMRLLMLCLVLLGWILPVWAQAPPPPAEVRTVDGTVSCLPAFTWQFPNGSVSCTTVGGKPAANIVLGATPGSVPWSNVTGGTSAGQAMFVTAGGSLVPGTGGLIEANVLATGNVDLRGPTHAGMTAGGMYAGDTTAGSVKIVAITQCDAVTEKIRWNTSTLSWECVTDQGGQTAGQVLVTSNDTTPAELNTKLTVDSSMSKAVQNPGANETLQLSATPPLSNVSPGTTTQAGTYSFQGTANVDVQTQLRLPSSTSPPAVDRELKIAETGDGTLVNKPQLAFQFGATNIYVPAPLTLPSADAQALTYNVAGQEYIWQRPATVCVSAVDTTCNYLNAKLVAGTGVTLTPSGAGNETLTISTLGGGGTDENVKVSTADTTAGKLEAKLLAGTNVAIVKNNVGANETLTINASSGTNNPGAPANSIQANDGAGGFRGFGSHSTATEEVTLPGALTTGGEIRAGGTGPGALDLPQSAGGNYVRIEAPDTVATNRTCKLEDDGTPFDPCVTTPPLIVAYDFAGCADGAAPTSNWDLESGTATPQCLSAGPIREGALRFAANNTCVQRKLFLPPDYLASGQIDAELTYEMQAETTNDVTWNVQVGCRSTNQARSAFAFNVNTPVVSAVSTTANGAQLVTFGNIPSGACAARQTLHIQVCKPTQSTTEFPDALQLVIYIPRT